MSQAFQTRSLNDEKQLISLVISVRPSIFCFFLDLHGTTPLLLDGFSRNVTFENFWRIHENKSVFIKIWKE